MLILRVRVSPRGELDREDDNDGRPGTVFCPTTSPLAPGTQVICELVAPIGDKILARGTVLSFRRARPRLRIRAGALVELAPEETAARESLLRSAGDAPPPAARRKHARLPIDLPVRWRAAGSAAFAPARLADIAAGGARLEGATPLCVGAEIVVEIVPPGAVLAIDVAARVVHAADSARVGIKFQCRDSGGSHRLRELVRRLRAS